MNKKLENYRQILLQEISRYCEILPEKSFRVTNPGLEYSQISPFLKDNKPEQYEEFINGIHKITKDIYDDYVQLQKFAKYIL